MPAIGIRIALYIVAFLVSLGAWIALERPKKNGAKWLLRCLAIPLVSVNLAALVGATGKCFGYTAETTVWVFIISSIVTIGFVGYFNLKVWRV